MREREEGTRGNEGTEALPRKHGNEKRRFRLARSRFRRRTLRQVLEYSPQSTRAFCGKRASALRGDSPFRAARARPKPAGKRPEMRLSPVLYVKKRGFATFFQLFFFEYGKIRLNLR